MKQGQAISRVIKRFGRRLDGEREEFVLAPLEVVTFSWPRACSLENFDCEPEMLGNRKALLSRFDSLAEYDSRRGVRR
jgi:hypothetical protein